MTREEFEKHTAQKTMINDFLFPHIDLSVGHYGFEQTVKDKDYVSNKGYPQHRLHFIVRGHLTLFVDGKKYKLRKNHCFCILPDVDMGFQTNPDSPAAFYWVTFSGQNVKAYLESMGFTEKRRYFHVPTKYQRRLTDAFYDNFKETNELHGRFYLDFLFVENFMKIAKVLSSTTETPKIVRRISAKRNYVEETLKLINERFADPEFSIRECAKELYLHENYLSHLFKEQMKQSFRTYLSIYRIERAVQMFESGQTSVSAVAYGVGFADPLYFSKVFKFYQRCTPSEQIKKVAEQNELFFS